MCYPNNMLRETANQQTQNGVDLKAASLPIQKQFEPLNIISVQQKTSYTCGAACLRAALHFFGLRSGGEFRLAARLGTTADGGTHPDDIVRVAKEHGLQARIHSALALSDLEKFVASGAMVIVAYQDWRPANCTVPWLKDWDNGHYALIAGIDPQHVYLRDPSQPNELRKIPRAEFLERWHDQDYKGKRWQQLGIEIRK